MKKLSIIALILLLELVAKAAIPAFPGAEGAGMYATGGRGGQVIEVTNLLDYKQPPEAPIAGSLRYALERPGARIIVFRVSGTIKLKASMGTIYPNVTIAGQTAPGDGIYLRDNTFSASTDNVIVRYLRFRAGDSAHSDIDSVDLEWGNNIILDHCSASWSVDETLSTPMSWNVNNCTVQWCMITEGLDKSVHTKGPHGKGSLIYSAYSKKFSFHHNIYAHQADRGPRVAGLVDYTVDPNGILFDFRNNVLYNWGGNYSGYSRGVLKPTRMNFVGNYYKPGVNSTGEIAFDDECVNSKAYFSGNWMHDGYPADPWSLVYFRNFTEGQKAAYKLASEYPIAPVTTDDAETAYAKVLAGAGATLPIRDVVDRRIVNEIKNGTGKIIDCVDCNSFYYPTGTAQGGAATTITLASNDPGSATTSHVGYKIVLLSGTGQGQDRVITAFNPTTDVATVNSPWVTIPDATTGYGLLIDCTNNAGGWPVIAEVFRPASFDSDHDGMPDEWELARGLNPNDANDGKTDRDGDGYTNVEEYLNWLVERGSPTGNFDTDSEVNFRDYALLAGNWLMSDCNDALIGSLDYDCNVDLGDLGVFVLNWLESSIE